jgi:enoyl-CoA hydratase
LGLINHVVPDGQALTKAKEVATHSAQNGPLAGEGDCVTLRETETLPKEAAFAIEQQHGMAVMTQGCERRPSRVARKARAGVPGSF